ncbi:hypothetical protein [Vagococcus jeotgali]|uniref:hypothetical protein n=1 Tax=Vagococcus jeotgali TaxID=3109030 RepID=UPI002DD897DF|nr:hypothetical protein [Vagococcus sp. B2T-5]
MLKNTIDTIFHSFLYLSFMILITFYNNEEFQISTIAIGLIMLFTPIVTHILKIKPKISALIGFPILWILFSLDKSGMVNWTSYLLTGLIALFFSFLLHVISLNYDKQPRKSLYPPLSVILLKKYPTKHYVWLGTLASILSCSIAMVLLYILSLLISQAFMSVVIISYLLLFIIYDNISNAYFYTQKKANVLWILAFFDLDVICLFFAFCSFFTFRFV